MNFGENGGVRCRTDEEAAAGWLGGGVFDGALTGVDGGGCRGTGGGHDAPPEWTGVFAPDEIGLTLGELPPPTAAAGVGTVGSSSPQLTAAPTGISPPQIEQRARMDTLVIFAGSSRNTDRHSGHETFIGSEGSVVSATPCEAARASMDPSSDRPRRPIPSTTSRTPSSPSPVH